VIARSGKEFTYADADEQMRTHGGGDRGREKASVMDRRGGHWHHEKDIRIAERRPWPLAKAMAMTVVYLTYLAQALVG